MLMARAISPSTSAVRIMPSATLLSPPVCCFLLRDAVLRLCLVPVLRLRAEVDYLKNLQALVLGNERRRRRKRR